MHPNWYEQGLAKAREHDFQGAIAAFDQAIAAAPTAAAYYQRGLAWFKLGAVPQAIEDYTQALQQEPTSNAAYARSLANLSAKDLAAAVADAKWAIELQPAGPAYELLGTIRQRQGETARAIACYKAAAQHYLDRHDAESCRRCLSQIQALQPPAAPAPVLHPPPTIEAYLEQAIWKAKQGHYQAAIADLDWAIQLDPHSIEAYLHRAQVQESLNPYGAIADYRQLAKLYLDRQDKVKAQQMLDRADRLQALSSAKSAPVRAIVRPIQPSIGQPSPAIRRKLLRLVGSDRTIITSLVAHLKLKYPGRSEDWYWEKAIYDLERDRW